MPKSQLDIALLIKTDSEWHRSIIKGIAQFSEDCGGWKFTIPSSDINGEVMLPEDWHGNGVIGRMTSQKLIDAIDKRNVPAVNVSWLSSHELVPKVVSDEKGCAKLVGNYFTEKQYENFGYVGAPPWCDYSDKIESQLREHYRLHGAELNCFELSKSAHDSMGIEQEKLERWVKSLPTPTAIVVWSSFVGYQVIMACHDQSLSIPRDIAVACFEHDPLWSALAPVPLSNVDQDPARVGYCAGKLIKSMIDGNPAPERPILINPISVVQRLSTEASAVRDPVLSLAINYIYAHAKTGITVKEIVSTLGVSRRTLEAKFRANLNCSPAVYVRRIQLQAVARLLRTTKFSVASIAKRTGFEYPEVLMRSFKREYGVTPMQFRGAGTLK